MIDLTKIEQEEMKPVYLVLAIYDVRDIESENGKELDQIIINQEILDMIDTINFTYVKDALEPTDVIKKVGYLMNLKVYLDPHRKSNNIIFTNDKQEICELEVKF